MNICGVFLLVCLLMIQHKISANIRSQKGRKGSVPSASFPPEGSSNIGNKISATNNRGRAKPTAKPTARPTSSDDDNDDNTNDDIWGQQDDDAGTDDDGSDDNNTTPPPAGFVQVSLPIIYPNETEQGSSMTVTIVASSTIGTVPTIYYTVDGTTPTTDTHTKIQSGKSFPITGNGYITIKALATITLDESRGIRISSKVSSKRYRLLQQVARPVLSPNGGTFAGFVRVRITCDTAGAMIYYSLNTPLPSIVPSNGGNGIFMIANGDYVTLDQHVQTVYSIARLSGHSDSELVITQFRILPKVDKPTILPNVNQFTLSATLFITTTTPATTIYYTLDGSDPTDASLVLTDEAGMIVVTGVGQHTIKAFATEPNMLGSDIATKVFTIVDRSPMPVLAPLPGRYVGDQRIVLSCPSATAVTTGVIYYTLDGSTPSGGNINSLSVPCNSAIALHAPGEYTVRAYAFLEHMAASAIVQATYQLIRPDHDLFPVNVADHYAISPIVAIHSLEKAIESESESRVVRGRLLRLSNPLGHISLVLPASGCSSSSSSSSSSSRASSRVQREGIDIGIDSNSDSNNPSHQPQQQQQQQQQLQYASERALRDLYHNHGSAIDTPLHSVSHYFSQPNPISQRWYNRSWLWDYTDSSVATALTTLSTAAAAATATATAAATATLIGTNRNTKSNSHVIQSLFGDTIPTIAEQLLWQQQEKELQLRNNNNKCLIIATAGYINHTDQRCFGTIVSDETVIQERANHNTHFGIRNGSYFIGYIDTSNSNSNSNSIKEGITTMALQGFDMLFSGSAWLVRHSASYVATSLSSAFGDMEDTNILTASQEEAEDVIARSAIGYDKEGRLLLLQIEGNSLYNSRYEANGVTLNELADICVEVGFESAMNIAGGELQALLSDGAGLSIDTGSCSATTYDSGNDDDIDIDGSNEIYRCASVVSTVLCVHDMPPPLFPNTPSSFSAAPTVSPSAGPTSAPTSTPTTSAIPTSDPSHSPTQTPTSIGSSSPSASPTARPTYFWEHVDDVNSGTGTGTGTTTDDPTSAPTVFVNNSAIDDLLALCTNSTEMKTIRQSVYLYKSACIILFIILAISILMHVRMYTQSVLQASAASTSSTQMQQFAFNKSGHGIENTSGRDEVVIDFNNNEVGQHSMQTRLPNSKSSVISEQENPISLFNLGGAKRGNGKSISSNSNKIVSEKDRREVLSRFSLEDDSESDEENHSTQQQKTKDSNRSNTRSSGSGSSSSSNRGNKDDISSGNTTSCNIEMYSQRNKSSSSSTASASSVSSSSSSKLPSLPSLLSSFQQQSYAPIRSADSSEEEDEENPFGRV